MPTAATRPQIRGVIGDLRRVEFERQSIERVLGTNPEMPVVGAATLNMVQDFYLRHRLRDLLLRSRGDGLGAQDQNSILADRLRYASGRKEVRKMAEKDFSFTLRHIGLDHSEAKVLANKVLDAMNTGATRLQTESMIKNAFEGTTVKGMPFQEALGVALRAREQKIVSQLEPHVAGIKGKAIDFGAGSGKIAQIMRDRHGIDIECVDVSNFKHPSVSIPFLIFQGGRVPVSDHHYEAAILTNVIHHDVRNQRIINELSRAVNNKLVIIESVPGGRSTAQWERTFLSDTLWNCFFHIGAKIPVPGTFEYPEGWVARFKKSGWKVAHSENLGYDQPIAYLKHHLFVFTREGKTD